MAKKSRVTSRSWTESEWQRMHPEVDPSSNSSGRFWPKIESARYDVPSQLVVLQLSNGARLGIPADKLEGVADANDERRSMLTVSASRAAIEFPQLDEQFSVAELLTGIFGSRGWVSELERHSAVPAVRVKSSVVPKTPVATKHAMKTKTVVAKKPAANQKTVRKKAK